MYSSDAINISNTVVTRNISKAHNSQKCIKYGASQRSYSESHLRNSHRTINANSPFLPISSKNQSDSPLSCGAACAANYLGIIAISRVRFIFPLVSGLLISVGAGGQF